MPHPRIFGLFLLSFAFGPIGAARGEEIVLIYGDVLTGEILSRTESTVTIRGTFGERTFRTSDIAAIRADGGSSEDAEGPLPLAPLPVDVETNSTGGGPIPPGESAWPEKILLGDEAGPAPATVSADGLSPYRILKKNVEIQSEWKDLEVAYLQRAYVDGKTVQTQYVARILPPDYLRANLTSPIPASPDFPEGGVVEYDLYRAKSMLWQVVRAPDQPIQYLRMDLESVPGLDPGLTRAERFQQGFAGAGSDEVLLQAIARNSRIVGSEYTEGRECLLMETENTPELVETQVSRRPPEQQAALRADLSALGRIRTWVGRADFIQWRTENYSLEGDLLLSVKMVRVHPNRDLDHNQLRMKVPKGTEWTDVTQMVAGQIARFLAPTAPGP